MFNADSINITATHSLLTWGFAAFAAGIFTYLSYRIINPPLPPLRKAFLIALRFIAFIAILLMIIEPVIRWTKSRDVYPHVAVLWDNSKSMSLSDLSGDRNLIVAELLNSKVFDRIESEHPVDFFAFSDTLIDFPGKLSLDGERTATGEALISLREKYAHGEPLGAIILVSDGQANYGNDPISVAYRLDVPIYSIGVGDPTPPKDIVLRQLTAQKVAYVDREFPIIVGVSANGYGGTETTVQLLADGLKVDEKRIRLPDRGEMVDVTFDVLPEKEGLITYRAFVPSLEDELTSTNNSRSSRVEVLPSKRKILVIGARPNWEMTFLLRALRTDPDLEVLTAFFGKSSPAGAVRVPNNIAEMQEYDAIYAIDCIKEISANNIDPALLEYVQSGGGLALQFLGDVNLGRSETWPKIFPFIYSSGSHVWTRDRFVPELTVQGLIHPVTRLSENIAQPAESYSKLPPLSAFAMLTGNVSGSISLLSHPRLPEVSIVAIREVGSGRVIMFNGADFWRWAFIPIGFGGDNKTYTALISGANAWLLAAGQGEAFAIETDMPVYRSGEDVIISARLRDESNQPLGGAEVSAIIVNSETDSSIAADTVRIVLEERDGGLYTSKLPSIGVGNWRMSASAELAEQLIARAGASFIVEPYSLEMENVRLDEIALRNISEITGGAYFRSSDIESLPEKIRLKPLLRREERERNLWDHPILLLIFTLALCAEWIIRKRSDLL